MDDVAEPVPGPADAIIDIAACGICGTDLTFIARGGFRDGDTAPMRIGHEAVGRIRSVGSDVAGLTPGMRVILNPQTAGSVIGNGGPEGAFTDRLLFREAIAGKTLYPIGHDIPDALAALAEPLAVSLHSVNRADPKPHETVVLFGAGPIGLGIVLWLHRRGVARLIVVDQNPKRLEWAKSLGATDVVVAGADRDLLADLRAICGGGEIFGMPVVDVDCFIDAAGAPPIVPQVVAMAKTGARLVIPASYKKPVTIDLRRLLMSEMTITTAMGYPTEFAEVIATLPELTREADLLISHSYDFADFFDALAVAQSGDCAKVMVTFPS
jgi:threonine dehydrogenase-like Zn-dependent dehydrogenase